MLKKARAEVTVLAIGRWLAANPDLAARIRDAGHELGNHTWSHRTLPRLDPAMVRVEVDRAAAELDRLTGSPGRWFRPSGTPSSTPAIRAAAVSAGYGACLGYDVDPLDYTDPDRTRSSARWPARCGRDRSSACTWATPAPWRRFRPWSPTSTTAASPP